MFATECFFYYIKALWLEFISIVPQSIKCLCFISYILYSAQTPVNVCWFWDWGGFFFPIAVGEVYSNRCSRCSDHWNSLSFFPHTHTLAIVSQTEGGPMRQKVRWGRCKSHFKEPYCSFAFSTKLWLISIHTCCVPLGGAGGGWVGHV